MLVAYDGTDFIGWQRQASGRSVQGEIESMLSRLCGDRKVTVVGAGRTDSGVHAAGQVAHADIESRYDDAFILHALQRMSASDIAIRRLETVSQEFLARYRASSRRYRYRIITQPDPMLSRYAWRLDRALDVDLLNEIAGSFRGRHDFTSFSKHNPDTPNVYCDVTDARWSVSNEEIEFQIAADRFLYGMVRQIVGFQIDVASERRSADEVDDRLRNPDRSGQSAAAPARGLTLHQVSYPISPFTE
jgi:tRNA pseudouridine38-40 synthase